MVNFLLLLAGFVALIFGADKLVDGASALAKRYNVPNIVIGLTIVAFGTSAPELVVNLFASFNNNSDLALGNIVGSNIFNVMGILGISALIYPLSVKTNTVWMEIPLSLLSAIVMIILVNDIFIDGISPSAITRIDGLILLAFFIIFMVYNITMMVKGGEEEEVETLNLTKGKSLIFILGGFIFLVVGGRLIVNSAVSIAETLGVSARIIGLTIVSIGTSLPELATSVIAARKKNPDIAIGNVVGSNIFNAFFILGTTAVVHPVALQPGSNIDLSLNIVASLLLFLFIFTGRRHFLDRWEGGLFLAGYVAYVLWLVMN